MAQKKFAHSVYDLSYHIILVTKYRRKVLTGRIADRLKAECARLMEEMGGSVREAETDEDHIHLLLEIPPSKSVSEVVNVMKGVTARLIRRDYSEEVKKLLWGGSLWSASYYAATAGGVTVDKFREYVLSQPTEEHKRKYEKTGKYRKKKKQAKPAKHDSSTT